MQYEQYVTNNKCECFGKKLCNCANKGPIYELFLENVDDIATSLIEVMGICGISKCKATASADVVKHWFLHYDEIRYRVDSVPRKRLCKDDLIHDLGRQCRMTRLEAQLAYGIIKRAFKAFYYGTCEGGLRNPILESQMMHSQACLWVHAAKRTAQIFASYAGMFYSSQKNYEAKIRCVYKHLYDRLKGRSLPLDLQECSCAACFKGSPEVGSSGKKKSKASPCKKLSKAGAQGIEMFMNDQNTELQSNDEVTSLIEEQPQALPNDATCKRPSPPKVHVPRCDRCKCPQLICDCNIARDIITTQCSQGPYKCFWMRMTDEEPVEQVSDWPEDHHHCPVDCDEPSDICDSECECDCENCDCMEEHSSDYDIDAFMIDEPEGMEEEEDIVEYDPCAPLFTSKLTESEQSSLYEFAYELVNDNRSSARESQQARRTDHASIDNTTKLRESETARPERLLNSIKHDTPMLITASPPKSMSNHKPKEQMTTPLAAEDREKQEILDLIGKLI